MYEIRQVNDMLTGASLIITIEENELDKKALCTIEETGPGFILPFRARHIDGKIEFIYQISILCKLQHITGVSTVMEYVQLWRNILYPLLECDDWFMKTQSFVLDPEHLYYDKEKKSISYIYIPAKRSCSERGDLEKMACELAKQMPVADMALENKILRMIMNDFKPREFLNMLNEYALEAEQRAISTQKIEPQVQLPFDELPPVEPSPISSPLKELQTNTYAKEPDLSKRADYASAVFEAGSGGFGDITIKMPHNDKESKKQKAKRKLFGKGKEQGKKEVKKTGGKKTANNTEKHQKANKQSSINQSGGKQSTNKQSADGYNKKSKNDELISSAEPSPICNGQQVVENEPFNDATEYISVRDFACVLRLVGSPLLPNLISVQIEDGEVFTIGRYDATVGLKQSSFEFERKTKAISRRHAAIEKNGESYSLTDLSSSAGTFVNSQKLPPNMPVELENGTRISFGTAGADYVFELRDEG